MSMDEWKTTYQKDASEAQKANFKSPLTKTLESNPLLDQRFALIT